MSMYSTYTKHTQQGNKYTQCLCINCDHKIRDMESTSNSVARIKKKNLKITSQRKPQKKFDPFRYRKMKGKYEVQHLQIFPNPPACVSLQCLNIKQTDRNNSRYTQHCSLQTD